MGAGLRDCLLGEEGVDGGESHEETVESTARRGNVSTASTGQRTPSNG
jgi:hypothetical protein